MLFRNIKKTRNIVILCFMLSFLWWSGSAWAIQSNMVMNSNGTMSGCLFNGQTEMCTMSFADHISHWQSMFTLTTKRMMSDVVFLVLLTFAVIVGVYLTRKNLLSIEQERVRRSLLYIREHYYSFFTDHLMEAFSDGILHPKTY